MACVTLKRSLDFDPFGNTNRTPKRRRCTPMSISSKSEKKPSPFGLAAPKLTSESIAASVRDELRRLQRRRRQLEPVTGHHDNGTGSSPALLSASSSSSSASSSRGLLLSPALPMTAAPMSEGDSSGSESDSGSSGCLSPEASGGASATSANINSSGSAPPHLTGPAVSLSPHKHADRPLFNFRQVGMICERILREREEKIREEYDRVLSAKLQEQYDMFVRFTQDQIVRNFEHSQPPSYLS